MPLCRVLQLARLEQSVARAEIEAGAGAFEMRDRGLGHIRDLPAGGAEPATPVKLFAVHEKALSEEADLRGSAGSDAQARPNQPIRRLRLVVRSVGHVVAAEHGV